MTYPLNDIDNYDGSGYALAAISDNRVAALAYIRDICAGLTQPKPCKPLRLKAYTLKHWQIYGL